MKYLLPLLTFAISITTYAVPMQLASGEFDSGFIFLPCSFDSHSDQCLLDTGSPKSLIKNDDFANIYSPKGTYNFAGANGVPVACDILTIKNYLFADSTLNNADILRCPSSVIFGDSVIGLDSLDGKILQMDFQQKTFSSEATFPKNGNKWPLSLYHLGHFGFTAGIQGQHIESIVDSGATITTVDQGFVRSHPDAFVFMQSIPGGSDSTNQPVTFELYQIKALTFENVNLQNVYALAMDFTSIRVFTGPNVKLVLGYNVLSTQNWYFDLSSKVWTTY